MQQPHPSEHRGNKFFRKSDLAQQEINSLKFLDRILKVGIEFQCLKTFFSVTRFIGCNLSMNERKKKVQQRLEIKITTNQYRRKESVN